MCKIINIRDWKRVRMQGGDYTRTRRDTPRKGSGLKSIGEISAEILRRLQE